MDYFSIVSQQVAEQFFVSDKEKNHWITNGLKTYLEIQYLKLTHLHLIQYLLLIQMKNHIHQL